MTKQRVALSALALATTLTLGGCAFLTPNWNALRPTSKPTPSDTASSSTPTPTPTAPVKLEKVDVMILNSTADETGIDVVAQASNISEDGGTCTLAVSQAAVKKIILAKAESNVTDTQCFPMHLPLDGFSSGTATFTVSYKSPTSTGVSGVGQVVIP